MRFLSFNALRSVDMQGVHYVKPAQMFAEAAAIRQADWVLFPDTWQLSVLAYVFKSRLFPSLASYHLGYDKVEMSRALLSLVPRHVPETVIVSADEQGMAAVLERLCFPLVVKVPRESMGRGVKLLEDVASLRAWTATQSVLYAQEFLPIDADLRVVYVGDQVVSAYWRRGGDGFHHNIACGGELDYEQIPAEALQLVAEVATALGVNYAGFDLCVVQGHWYFLEFNLFFGTAGLNSQGLRLGPIISDYLQRQTPVLRA